MGEGDGATGRRGDWGTGRRGAGERKSWAMKPTIAQSRESPRRPVLVLGGGFAGLAAAVDLAEAGRPVLLLERRSFLGGRAYSFADKTTGDTIDNGQHLMMGCYHRTLRFLEK